MPAQLSILVVIANYGTANDGYLQRVLEEFRAMPWRLDLHVVTNLPKNWGPDVTVHVGLPSRDPWSLPFAHRRIFAENLAKADYFIYCEDDTLITQKNIRAFMEAERVLEPGEIPGFLRAEHTPGGECFLECAHGPYRWLPSSVVRRGGMDFAHFTNLHSAFTMASRAHMRKAIDSGQFLVRPHMGRFDMLVSAATDLYTQCGMGRLVCLSRIEDFLVRHLANKYYEQWGLRFEEFLEQTRAVQRITPNGSGWKGSLLEVETRMPLGRWSKNLYAHPDSSVLDLIPAEAKTVLSVGSGWGAVEEFLVKRGKQVSGLPVDAVFADCLRRRGVEALEGPFDETVGKLAGRQFDAILMLDVLHLLPSPVQWLSKIKPLLSPNGLVLASTPRTFDLLRLVWYLRGVGALALPKSFDRSHVQRVTSGKLRRWFAAAGLEARIFPVFHSPKRFRVHGRMRGFGDGWLMDQFIVRAKATPV